MGLVVIAIAVAWILYMQRGSHIEPAGKILKVRTLAADENSSIAVIDFRVENASNFGIIVREVTVTLDEPNGKTDEGAAIAEMDAQRLFQYYPILGPKYNDTLKIRDRIKAHEIMDRMLAVRFEIPQAQVDGRKALRLRVEDVDGPSGEIVERK